MAKRKEHPQKSCPTCIAYNQYHRSKSYVENNGALQKRVSRLAAQIIQLTVENTPLQLMYKLDQYIDGKSASHPQIPPNRLCRYIYIVSAHFVVEKKIVEASNAMNIPSLSAFPGAYNFLENMPVNPEIFERATSNDDELILAANEEPLPHRPAILAFSAFLLHYNHRTLAPQGLPELKDKFKYFTK